MKRWQMNVHCESWGTESTVEAPSWTKGLVYREHYCCWEEIEASLYVCRAISGEERHQCETIDQTQTLCEMREERGTHWWQQVHHLHSVTVGCCSWTVRCPAHSTGYLRSEYDCERESEEKMCDHWSADCTGGELSENLSTYTSREARSMLELMICAVTRETDRPQMTMKVKMIDEESVKCLTK